MMIVVMGVAGSGKTTLGELLADAISADFWDGDHFHTQLCIEKMRSGQPLTPGDRRDWVQRIVTRAIQQAGETVVVACSALQRETREQLCIASKRQKLIWLSGSYRDIHRKLAERSEHYFPPALLKSQFEDLEEPVEALRLQCYEPLPALISLSLEYIRRQ